MKAFRSWTRSAIENHISRSVSEASTRRKTTISVSVQQMKGGAGACGRASAAHATVGHLFTEQHLLEVKYLLLTVLIMSPLKMDVQTNILLSRQTSIELKETY